LLIPYISRYVPKTIYDALSDMKSQS
jgi:hypothetical protein